MKNKYVNDKSYSKEAVEYAKKRTEYEMGWINNMPITEEQKSCIEQHIYFTARKAYDCGETMKDKEKAKQEDNAQTPFEGCKILEHEILVYGQQDCNDLCALLARNGYCTIAYYLPYQLTSTAVPKGWKIVYYDPKDTEFNNGESK